MFDQFEKAMTSAAGLNESPSEKEGKSQVIFFGAAGRLCLNESPSEKEGKSNRSKNLRG